jgi:L-alanine-DL-glutamate epimerase-like enolase superfamily enzyme
VTATSGAAAAIDRLDVEVYEIPLDEPESDGTLTWDRTTVILARPRAVGTTGLGYTYGTGACATVIEELLRDAVVGRDTLDVGGAWTSMVRAIRNQGRPGVCSMAISAVDTALWDLKARLLEQPLVSLLGAVRDEVPVYGSGGFTSLDDDALREQLLGWAEGEGIPRVKIKVGESWGSNEERDLERTAVAREVLGDDIELYVDANGGYARKQAVRMAPEYEDLGVRWFEEPVSSDDLEGLREVRDTTDVDVAAGEYGYDLVYFERMVAAGAVDCLQVDVTRCGGITEFLRAAAVAAAHGLDVSAHCAPALSVAPCAAVPNFRHVEYFADHVRAEALLFDGVLDPKGGALRPDRSRAGNGLELKEKDAERFRKG